MPAPFAPRARRRRDEAHLSSKLRGSYDSQAAEPPVRGLPRARERWALTGRRDRPGTACAARAELGGYCLRFRAPPRATIWRRAPLQRCGAASDGADLSSPTHRSSTPKGGMDARAMGCCHAPACVRVRTQPPCPRCACAIGRSALSRPRGDRCRQTCCHAIVAAVRSFGTSPARCRRHQVRSPTRVALRPTHTALGPWHCAPSRPRAALRRRGRRYGRRPALSVA